jgi:hypothetical protein
VAQCTRMCGSKLATYGCAVKNYGHREICVREGLLATRHESVVQKIVILL